MLNNNDNIIKKINIEIDKIILFFKKYLLNLHFGIANTNILNNIKIKINNKIYNIYDLSNINVLDKTTLKITPYNKNDINIIKNYLIKNNIDGTIYNKKNNIIIKLSIFTEEKRINFIKKIKIEYDKIIISLRNIRNKFNNLIKKKNISNDDKNIIKNKIQKILNNKIYEIKNIFLKKKNEILKI
ncbi:MAG: ribosome-recycling factor [Candidatus Shikimatogenerans bostrichidophilus]|nr:MAG: ribosome-recycling factor [Candidatus Shikimatogenerans bostrichidophilus]